MTRLEKRIAFDMVLFYATVMIFWIFYRNELNVMDHVWKIVMAYMISSSASIYSVIVTNKYLKDFCILVSFLRFSIMLIYIFALIFDFETNTKGPHLVFIGISTVIAFLLSKSNLILRIRQFHEWLNLD